MFHPSQPSRVAFVSTPVSRPAEICPSPVVPPASSGYVRIGPELRRPGIRIWPIGSLPCSQLVPSSTYWNVVGSHPSSSSPILASTTHTDLCQRRPAGVRPPPFSTPPITAHPSSYRGCPVACRPPPNPPSSKPASFGPRLRECQP